MSIYGDTEMTNVSVKDMYIGATIELGREASRFTKETGRKLTSSIRKTRIGRKAEATMDKINTFVDKPAVIKAATTGMGLETIFGFFATCGTATLAFSTGAWVFGILVILGFLIGCTIRYTLARASIHNVQEA